MCQNYALLVIIFITVNNLMANTVTTDFNLRKGNEFYALENLDQALVYYRRCLNIDPNNADCLCNLASCLIDTGNNDDGEYYYRRALTSDPNHSGALFNLAILLQDSHDTIHVIDAKNLYLKLLELEPNNSETWANIGQCILYIC